MLVPAAFGAQNCTEQITAHPCTCLYEHVAWRRHDGKLQCVCP